MEKKNRKEERNSVFDFFHNKNALLLYAMVLYANAACSDVLDPSLNP